MAFLGDSCQDILNFNKLINNLLQMIFELFLKYIQFVGWTRIRIKSSS